MSRRLAILFALLLLVVVILWLRHRGSGDHATAQSDDGPAQVNTKPWVLAPPAQVAKVEAKHKADRSRVGLWMLEDPNLPMMVADSLIVSRFPRDSLPLTKYQVQQLQPNRRFDSKSPVTHKDLTVEPDMQVLLTGDKYRLVGADVLTMTMQLFQKDRQIPFSVVAADALAKAIDGSALGADVPVSFSDRGDGTQTATLQLSGTPIEKHAGKVDVEVQYDPGNGKLAYATLDALYQPGGPPPAVFNGKFREQLNNGSLDIYCGVDVTEAGSYMIEANLFDANHEPAVYLVGRMVPLAVGSSEVKLEAFGRVVEEQSSPSPFTLENLRGYIFYEGQDPDRKLMPDYGGVYQTQKYPPGSFSDDEYWDQHKQDQITHLLGETKNAPPGSPIGTTIGEASAQGWKPNW